MTEKKSYEQLYKELKPHLKLVNRTMLHIKSNTYYILYSIQHKESDMSLEFTYGPINTKYPIKFSRPISELTDGRFSF
jgi:hypothetical protein